MKKMILTIALLTSTLLNAHGYKHGDEYYHPNLSNYSLFNDNFWRDFDRQFQQFDYQMNRLQRNMPTLDTSSKQYFDKDKNSYIMEIKTSGIDKKNFEISSDENRLIIKAKQNASDDNKKSSSSFFQMVSIPADGDIANISAKFKDGILKISIPKLKKTISQIKKITIQ